MAIKMIRLLAEGGGGSGLELLSHCMHNIMSYATFIITSGHKFRYCCFVCSSLPLNISVKDRGRRVEGWDRRT